MKPPVHPVQHQELRGNMERVFVKDPVQHQELRRKKGRELCYSAAAKGLDGLKPIPGPISSSQSAPERQPQGRVCVGRAPMLRV